MTMHQEPNDVTLLAALIYQRSLSPRVPPSFLLAPTGGDGVRQAGPGHVTVTVDFGVRAKQMEPRRSNLRLSTANTPAPALSEKKAILPLCHPATDGETSFPTRSSASDALGTNAPVTSELDEGARIQEP
ncbi:hypothetical protein SKAU_G00013740 [Synaphobranchus kaupii]|uniref:Uncharacterized protein n=1 Tax=Synaphobranchus kaupii TaxID=118154 RepID=A0A9Q1GAI1_SYNKA|nr:hypothetical protein SKAU_G00013740 [Synaphobranchus kaupii]